MDRDSKYRFYFRWVIILISQFLFNTKSLAQQIINKNNEAQNPISRSKQIENVTFQSLPPEFNYRGVRCILQDYKGLIWFGTTDGLVSFDGINIKAYENHPEDNTTISSNEVNAIIEDNENNLWIGTSKGLDLYNRAQDNFMGIPNQNMGLNLLNYSYITSFHVDETNLLWIGTFGYGLNIYDHKNKKNVHYEHSPQDANTLSSTRITSIVSDADNNVWVGTQSGLNLFQNEPKSFRRFYNELGNPSSLSDNNITSLQKDIYGQIWIGTEGNGLNLLVKEENSFQFKRYTTNSKKAKLSGNFINDLYADNKGNLWIGTENFGLNKLNIKSNKLNVYKNIVDNNKTISSNSIWSIYGDNEDRIWIGTYNKGINVVDKKNSRFESYERNSYSKISLPNNDARGLTIADNGKIWVATDGGGICQFDINTRTFDKLIQKKEGKGTLSSNSIQTILYDNKQNIWVGSWGAGVDRLNKEGKLIKNYKVENGSGVGNNKTKVLYQDKKGNIWAGTNGSGLFVFDWHQDAFEPVGFNDFLTQGDYVNSIVSDSDSSLWVGTLDGLIKLKYKQNPLQSTAEVFRTNNSEISSNTINVVFVDEKDKLYIGTSNGGLNLLRKENGTFKTIQKKDGLPSNNISGILKDDKGKIWVSTNAGIAKIDIPNNKITTFTKEDGLNSNSFYPNSCLKAPNGILFFGSDNGFNLFHPNEIKTNMHLPQVLLTGLKIDNVPVKIGAGPSPLKKQISETKVLELNHKQSSFSIDFVALNYTNPTKNQFCYQLEGFDKQWNCVGTKRNANYTNVPPGSYLFKVKGSNNDGLWNESPATLKIIIRPPYYKTWWAYLIYFVTITLVAIIIIKAWRERIRFQNQLKVEKLAKEKERELNEKNIEFFTNISHEFRTPLSLITGPLESLINSATPEVKENLLVIQKNANRLLTLTNELMDIQKLEEGGMKLKIQKGDIIGFIKIVTGYFRVRFERLNLDFSIDTNEDSISAWFDKEKLTTILVNLLSNAIKYSEKNGTVRIKIKQHPSLPKNKPYQLSNLEALSSSFVEISVINSGIGIHPEELPFIFDKFYQTSGRKKKQLGSGIGLTLTKGLVEVHNGEIWVESEPNQETKFTFLIPIDKSAFEPKYITDEETDIYEQEIQLNDIDEPAKTEANYSKNNTKDDKPRILIVEDNPDLRLFLAKEIEKEYIAIQAPDGEDGLKKALEHTPDLIISDILMPNKSGIELCKDIKSDIKTSHIPVILLTAKTTTEDQIQGIDTGADAYMTKPFNLNLLLTQINNLLHSRRELYAQFSKDVYIMPKKFANENIDQEFLQKTIDFIVKNMTDTKLNAESLTNFHSMSHSNLYRKIKSLTGNTIIEFIRIVKLKQALILMESKKHSLAEISYLTGFTSPSYFTKKFREHYGKPPSEYLS